MGVPSCPGCADSGPAGCREDRAGRTELEGWTRTRRQGGKADALTLSPADPRGRSALPRPGPCTTGTLRSEALEMPLPGPVQGGPAPRRVCGVDTQGCGSARGAHPHGTARPRGAHPHGTARPPGAPSTQHGPSTWALSTRHGCIHVAGLGPQSLAPALLCAGGPATTPLTKTPLLWVHPPAVWRSLEGVRGPASRARHDGSRLLLS